MLALTKEAAEAVETIVNQPEAPDDAVMRITGAAGEQGEEADPERGLQMSVVGAPEPGDSVVQRPPIAIESAAAEFLDDKVLDAEAVEGGIQFRLYLQPEGGLPPQGEAPPEG